jgi:hypothetical protein
MRYLTLLLLFFSVNQFLVSQYNCQKIINPQGEEIKSCYHKNGRISTQEIWENNKKSGKSIGYNSSGEQLYEFNLRTFGGHASVHLSYYASGQVSKVQFSSAPDGGIQWYKEMIRFDEMGVQIEKRIDQYPYELTVPVFRDTSAFVTPIEKKTIKQEVIGCAIPYVTYYKIKNSTSKKIEVKLIPQINRWVQLSEKNRIINSKEFATCDSIIQAQRFLEPTEGYLVLLNIPKRKANKFQILPLERIHEVEKRTYQWIIIKK